MSTGNIQFNRATIAALASLTAILRDGRAPTTPADLVSFTYRHIAQMTATLTKRAAREGVNDAEPGRDYGMPLTTGNLLAFQLVEMATRPDCRVPNAPRDRQPVDPMVFTALSVALAHMAVGELGQFNMRWDEVVDHLSGHLCMVLHLASYHGSSLRDLSGMAECRRLCGITPCEHTGPYLLHQCPDLSQLMDATR